MCISLIFHFLIHLIYIYLVPIIPGIVLGAGNREQRTTDQVFITRFISWNGLYYLNEFYAK